MSPEKWQQVKHIFAAIQEADEPLPEDFVSAACAGDEAVRHEVERLLSEQHRAGSFMQKPGFPGGLESEHPDTAQRSFGPAIPPGRWERLKLTYQQAIDLSAADRPAFLDRIRNEDAELARLVDAALRGGDETRDLEAGSARVRQAPGRGEEGLFSPGDLVLQRFRIVRLLGRGGMGEVYEAEDLRLGRVAIKTIRPEMASNESHLARFQKEVQLALKVTNPHVCRIRDLFVVPASPGNPQISFLTMEFLEGCTLAEHIRREGALPLAEAESIALQLCSALEAIHKAGVIHRDFKSQNIMLVPRAEGKRDAVVMDLGLARETAPPALGEAGLTGMGVVMGTPEYMAPEQFQGLPVSPATDVYAFGLVLYEISTGTRAYHAATPLAAAIMRAKPPSSVASIRPDVPAHWDKVIGRCLEYEPGRRYQSAAEVAESLRSWPAALGATPVRRNKLLLPAIVLSFVLLIAGASLLWVRAHTYSKPSEAARRWYEQGVDALREGTYLKATQALSRAVQLDRGFVLAHARLADAWAELDFTGKAQAEILRASELEIKSGLPEVDKHYVDAVRATLTFDFAGAAQDYQLVLKALPEPEKAYGYVDLGRAYEKAGNVADAMKCYSEAVRLAPEFPASLVRRGILESRNGKAAAGEADFSQADKLYSASSNMEGTAEIAYQRSYAASLVGDMTHARQYLQQSLHLAGEISSPQLEIRALTRLATVEYLSDNTDQSIQLANRSIQLAREKGLDYWAIDALVRLGNAYITLKDFDRAEPTLQEALRLAQEGQRKRPEATAQLSLASIRNLQGNPDETIALAQKALEYYKKAGFFRDSIDALTLIIRSERDKADFKKALQDSTEALQIVSKTANPSLTMQIEELAGSVLLSLERFPEAMAHFQNALSIARSIDQNIEYQTLHCADTAWQLGRYAEAEQLLQSIRPIAVKHPPIARAVARIEAQMELSKLNYPAAEQLAKRLLSEPGAVSAETAIDLQIVEGSDTRQSRAKESVSSCRSALDLSTGKKDLVRIARSNLCQAAAQMAAGSPKEAQASADAAARFFSATGLAQSEWRALLTTAKIQRELGDFEKARNNSIKALEILSGTQHSWAVSDKITFQARPDIGAANRELMQLSKN